MSNLYKFRHLMSVGKNETANECLRKALETDSDNFFNALRNSDNPVLKFWSYHPGNPDIKIDPTEDDEGYAFLLSTWQDVRFALENLSMRSYARISANDKSPFILSEDDPAIHGPRRKALAAALVDPRLFEKMDESVDESWQQFKNGDQLSSPFDIRRFGRTVALKFTAKYFGIDENLIFGGVENLEKWSEAAYENFIWKLHGRHFDDPNPDMGEALEKIGGIVGQSIQIQVQQLKQGAISPDANIITRLLAADVSSGVFDDLEQVGKNIVGLIQGLVDNAMTGACCALNRIYQQNPKDFQNIRELRSDTDRLKQIIHTMHQLDTPSPYLPRRGKLRDLPSFNAKQFPGEDPDAEVIFSCAIGSAITDRVKFQGNTEDWDIRMGSGMHECIGKYVGDELMTRIVARVLEVEPVEFPYLEKQWGWIVKRFVMQVPEKDLYGND